MTCTTSTKLAVRLGLLLVAGGFAGGAGAQHLPGTARAASVERAAIRAYEFPPLGAPPVFAPPALARIPGGSFAMGNSFRISIPMKAGRTSCRCTRCR